jgi:hypothetical protein
MLSDLFRIHTELAAALTLDSNAGNALEGMYLEISCSAAEVNCASSVAWRLSFTSARVFALKRTTARIDDNI